MKRILAILILWVVNGYFAQANEQNEIQFIYINGSNNNDKKMTEWFFNGMNKLHPKMKEAFSTSEYTQEKFLENGKYSISEKPEAFFWGDKSSEEIESINSDLNITKMFSPRLAQRVRSFMAHCLHDAIWVSHYRNMHPVIEDLHKQIVKKWALQKQSVAMMRKKFMMMAHW